MSELLQAALAELGVRRLLLAIHDVSFPSESDEDVGRGSPATRGGDRLLAFARALGFTGLQLGPQGQTARGNPSPYDGTIFSRHVGTIALRSLRRGGAFEGLVDDATLASAVSEAGGPAQHARAHDAMARLLEIAHSRLRAGARPDVAAGLAEFRARHASWLERDALFAALCDVHDGRSFREWPADEASLWNPAPADAARAATRRHQLAQGHARAIDRYALGQYLAHEEHARVRDVCARLGLAMYGDLQVGYSEADKWAHAAAFLTGYAMGAPPSRTNPEGQPWNYPVLDPGQLAGAARDLVVARVDKALAEYDSLRIDHPHGLVCPWVYRTDTGADGVAVRDGARLFESPDLPDHPRLAAYAIARADQLVRGLPRYADGWVQTLDDAQVARYAVLFEALAAAADRHGRSINDLSCEVLSTMPYPLGRVLARYGLGRWRVFQKANLDDATDVYRPENAASADWVMLGNHDTAPIFALIRSFSADKRAQWIAHLRDRLRLPAAFVDSLAHSNGRLATAMLAELFASRAQNVSIFFADLFGLEDRFNAPGTVSDENWCLRLPADFDTRYARDRVRDAALDVSLALALALEARGSTSDVASRLRAVTGAAS